MTIFNSYVKLPEGIRSFHLFCCIPFCPLNASWIFLPMKLFLLERPLHLHQLIGGLFYPPAQDFFHPQYLHVSSTYIWLVVYLPLWKMMEFVSWDDDIPNIWENKKCSKPPTRYYHISQFFLIFSAHMGQKIQDLGNHRFESFFPFLTSINHPIIEVPKDSYTF